MNIDPDYLIYSYLRGELSEEEQQQLDKWLEEDPANYDMLTVMEKVWKTPIPYPAVINLEDEKEKTWRRISDEEHHNELPQTTKHAKFGRWWRYAAVLLIALGIGFVMQYFSGGSSPEPHAVTTIVRENPFGQKSVIHLPDGSNVWLNAGSKLTYSSDFNVKTRRLHLAGEAYFEVAKNKAVPFRVFTNQLVVTAVGTSFDVNAFSSGKTEKVALNTGKVKVECLGNSGRCKPRFLVPGHHAIYNSNSGKIQVGLYKGDNPFAWKDGKLVFDHATFPEVIEVLRRWYNVDFVVKGASSHQWDYSSTFENEVLENVLESLKFSEKIDYSIEGSTIKIKL